MQTMSKLWKQKTKKYKHNHSKQTESQLKILRKSTDQIKNDTDKNCTSNIIGASINEEIKPGGTTIMTNVLTMTLLILRNLLPWSFKISTRKLLT